MASQKVVSAAYPSKMVMHFAADVCMWLHAPAPVQGVTVAVAESGFADAEDF